LIKDFLRGKRMRVNKKKNILGNENELSDLDETIIPFLELQISHTS
jgi:hypothetical protein